MNRLDTFTALFVSRRDDFAIQRPDGGYRRAGRVLTSADILAHLKGVHTLGSYVINEQGLCIYAVFDADTEEGFHALLALQKHLAALGIVSYLELSRRGAHLWIFLAAPALASLVRAWLLPYCPAGVEFYPKQNESQGYGSLIRLPFGVHLRSGKRYPFVVWTPQGLMSVASTLQTSLDWLATVERVAVPDPATFIKTRTPRPQAHKDKSFSSSSVQTTRRMTIREWCAAQDPYSVIGRYVDLSTQGLGHCPFGWHHANGTDQHASFKVYTPGVPGGYCWYCHVWQQGGSVFDFLRYYFNKDARTLWQELQQKEVALW
jgi:hypothetical protein